MKWGLEGGGNNLRRQHWRLESQGTQCQLRGALLCHNGFQKFLPRCSECLISKSPRVFPNKLGVVFTWQRCRKQSQVQRLFLWNTLWECVALFLMLGLKNALSRFLGFFPSGHVPESCQSCGRLPALGAMCPGMEGCIPWPSCLGGKWVMWFELAKKPWFFTLKGIFYSWAEANWNTLCLGLFIQTRTMRSIFNRKWGKGSEKAAEVIGSKGRSLKLNIMA